MSTSPEHRIAGAPIPWGVCEVPGWGHRLAPQQVLTGARDVDGAAVVGCPEGRGHGGRFAEIA